MHRFVPAFLLFALVALPTVAEPFSMSPVAPTPTTPIVFTIYSGCGNVDEIARSGKFIRIWMSVNPCSPPRTEPIIVPLPEKTLPAGEYRAEMYVNVPGLPIGPDETLDFVVQPRHSELPFHVHPSTTFTMGGATIHLSRASETTLCATNDCEVSIDGVVVAKTFTADGGILVTAPAHDPGLYTITIMNRGGGLPPISSYLYYYDAGEPLPSVFERVLFPILHNRPGANGSDWRTETWIANNNVWTIDNANDVQGNVCVTFPCGERIGPRSVQAFEGGIHPYGVALLVPRTEAPYLSFASRVRDVAHAADNFGSELPVVREHDMIRGGAATLLGIPVDPRYRVKVRLYAFNETTETTAHATVTITERMQKRTVDVTLTRECHDLRCSSTPFYGELDLPAGEADARVNLEVRAAVALDPVPPLVWAFASVTNNSTQQVTIIRADGQSGLCANCP